MEPQLVYGLYINDPRHAILTRRVVRVAIVTMVLSLILHIASIVDIGHGPWQGKGEVTPSIVFSMLLALVLPCCGYLGAKQSNKALLCCFCGCNCLASFCTILSVILLFVVQGAANSIIQRCDPSYYKRWGVPDGCPSKSEWSNSCNEDDAFECYDKYSDFLDNGYWGIIVVICIFAVPNVILQCCGFCWGNELYKQLKQGRVIHQVPVQYATNAVRVQPRQQPGMALQQPGMALQQPGMALQQPGFALQQPGMALQQPGMAPQQPGWAPQITPQQPALAPQQQPAFDPQQQQALAPADFAPSAPLL